MPEPTGTRRIERLLLKVAEKRDRIAFDVAAKALCTGLIVDGEPKGTASRKSPRSLHFRELSPGRSGGRLYLSRCRTRAEIETVKENWDRGFLSASLKIETVIERKPGSRLCLEELTETARGPGAVFRGANGASFGASRPH